MYQWLYHNATLEVEDVAVYESWKLTKSYTDTDVQTKTAPVINEQFQSIAKILSTKRVLKFRRSFSYSSTDQSRRVENSPAVNLKTTFEISNLYIFCGISLNMFIFSIFYHHFCFSNSSIKSQVYKNVGRTLLSYFSDSVCHSDGQSPFKVPANSIWL